MSELLLNSIPGLLTGVITGIIILVIEYKTGWFIKKKQNIENNRTGYTVFNNRNKEKSKTDWLGLFFDIPIFVGIFLMVFLLLGIPLSLFINSTTSTVLDNSENQNITVKTITEGDTKTFFNNDLFISVNSISLGEVYFTVGSVGFPNQFVERARNGEMIIYNAGINNYHVRLTSVADSSVFVKDSVDFTVIKNP
ncbi:MAG: hypothetical protein JNK81_11095 [Anaerolineales bacterium]|nr:hypothetical protein [Anaerolineales bacterium]